MPVAIKFENISKQYRLGEVGTGTLSHDLHRAWAKLRGKPDPFAKVGQNNDRTLKSSVASNQPSEDATSGSGPLPSVNTWDYVWALKDIDFEVQEGEILGIIGRNGAGKSTLLKILSRVTAPTTGSIKAKGRIASLLEVGTGFHPELTGRENIYLNGAILGMRRHEITCKLEEIVEFSGCAKYIDTPVKRYSSGMTVRLGFAVAAHLDCEILVVDEVLAVGDVEFQKKCIGKMKEVSFGSGKTVLFVSHNMTAMSALCTTGLLLESGRSQITKNLQDAICGYLKSDLGPAATVWTGSKGDSDVELIGASIAKQSVTGWNSNLPIVLNVRVVVRTPVNGLIVAWKVRNSSEQLVAYTAAEDMFAPPGVITSPGTYNYSLEIPGNTFAAGDYDFSLDLGIHNLRQIVPQNEVSFSIRLENTMGIGRRYPGGWNNCVRAAWIWDTKSIPSSTIVDGEEYSVSSNNDATTKI